MSSEVTLADFSKGLANASFLDIALWSNKENVCPEMYLGRISHQSCSLKKLFVKILQCNIHRKTPVLESFLIKLQY